jgi:transposase
MNKKGLLTKKQVVELQKVRRNKEFNVEEVMRAVAILMLDSGSNEFMIENSTGFKKRSALKFRQKYLKNGLLGIVTRKRKSRALLTKKQMLELAEILQNKGPKDFEINADFWTTSILAEFIKKHFNVAYQSKTSYCIIFKKSGFTYHKPDKVYKNRNQENIDAWKKEKTPEIKQYLNDKDRVVLTGDEMILTTKTTTQKVWLATNSKFKLEASNKGGKRCIYGFLNVKTGCEHAFKTDYTNSLTTCNVFEELIKIYPDKKITIIWDNASWHKSITVRAFLEKNPYKFHLIALPPYAPELNPQECVWKAGRTNVTHNKFIENIDAAADEFVDYLNTTKFEYKFL